MKRLITKKMRDSFNPSFNCRVNLWSKASNFKSWLSVYNHFEAVKKQRILILKGTIK